MRLPVPLALLLAASALSGCQKKSASKGCPDRPTGHKYIYVSAVDLKDACFAKHEYRVAGRLKPGSHRVRPVGHRTEHRFVLYRGNAELPVTYFGPVPDKMRNHLIIILVGKVKGGRFVAHSFAFDFNSFAPMHRY